MVWLPEREKKFDDTFSSFDRILTCDGRTEGQMDRRQTDRQTDRRTSCDSTIRAVTNARSIAAWSSGVCVSRVVGRHSQPHTMRVLTSLLPAVMDQLFVDNRDFYTPPALLTSLEKGETVFHTVVWRVWVLLTHLCEINFHSNRLIFLKVWKKTNGCIFLNTVYIVLFCRRTFKSDNFVCCI